MDGLIYLMWYLLIIGSILFLISGLDDLFFDFMYWIRYLYRKWKTRKYHPITYKDLVIKAQQKIAIIVPCWHEDNVIKEMLRYNISGIDYENYDFFIGVYPNDPKTVDAVKQVSELYPHLQYMIGPEPGPTTKAANLNHLCQYITDYETVNNIKYDIIVMHDSEDVIHPLSLRFYNYLLPRKNMIQLPVFPLEVPWWKFTHWVYNDEFAENHTKDIIVREAINGLVPSAGVSTAFSRETIDELARLNDGVPFSTSSFTEDYDTALRINLHHLKGIFVFQRIKVSRLKRGLFGTRSTIVTEPVAARSLFPTQYKKSVKQKARWIMGISMQEWALVGWKGNLSTRYTLLHDRKTLLTHYINILGYVVFIFWVFYLFWQRYHPEYPALQEFFNNNPWVWYIIVICTVIMIERLIQRGIAVYRVYGLIPALLSAPRAIYGNIVNMHALLRAYQQFFFHSRKKGGIRWEKTEHTFPTTSQLNKIRPKLGHLLLQNKFLTERQFSEALYEQMASGNRLGDILVKKRILTEEQLLQLLAMQDELDFIELDKNDVLPLDKLGGISKSDYKWMLRNKVFPIAIKDKTVTFAIPNPADSQIKSKIAYKIRPYSVKYVVYVKII